jgi:hypothetical protein
MRQSIALVATETETSRLGLAPGALAGIVTLRTVEDIVNI